MDIIEVLYSRNSFIRKKGAVGISNSQNLGKQIIL